MKSARVIGLMAAMALALAGCAAQRGSGAATVDDEARAGCAHGQCARKEQSSCACCGRGGGGHGSRAPRGDGGEGKGPHAGHAGMGGMGHAGMGGMGHAGMGGMGRHGGAQLGMHGAGPHGGGHGMGGVERHGDGAQLGMHGAGPHGGGHGVGAPGGRGPLAGDSAAASDRELFHYLLDHRGQIRRKVTTLPDGVETLTESDDPAVAQGIRDHVTAMRRRLEERRPIHARDPLFAAIFAHADKITMTTTTTEKGIRVKETSTSPEVVRLIQAHAVVVDAFLANGHREMHRDHPVPGAKP